MQRIIIDFEFTGLDNTYITDNDIIQMKMKNIDSGHTYIRDYGSDKALSAHVRLHFRNKVKMEGKEFDKEDFENAIMHITGGDEYELFGFSVSQDKKMLAKYGIKVEITDIQEWVRLQDNCLYEYEMATEGHGLEEIYMIVTGRHPHLENHSGLEELLVIEEIMKRLKRPTRSTYTVMPWGHCSGMPLDEYIQHYRRSADGYRYNNNDVLATSLDDMVEIIESGEDDDDDDGYDEQFCRFVLEDE